MSKGKTHAELTWEREREGGKGEGGGSSLDIHKCKQEICQLDNRNPPKIRIREQRGGEGRPGGVGL